MFAEKGFHSATIKDIAREAGVADGTIYNYFENKMALMLGLLDRMNESDRRDADLSQLARSDFRSLMKAYIRHRLMLLKADNFETFRVVVSEIMVNRELRELHYQKILEPTFALAEKYFQWLVEQRLVKPVDVGLTMRAVSGMVFGLIMEYVLGDKILEEKWDELPDLLTTIILDGLGGNNHAQETGYQGPYETDSSG